MRNLIPEFFQDIEYEQSQHPKAKRLYRHLYGPEIEINYNTELSTQKRGFDVELVHPNGTSVIIDEKHSRLAKMTGNLFLESWSNPVQQKPGWLRKDMMCDCFFWFISDTRTSDALAWRKTLISASCAMRMSAVEAE